MKSTQQQDMCSMKYGSWQNMHNVRETTAVCSLQLHEATVYSTLCTAKQLQPQKPT